MSIAGLHNITSVTFTDQAGDGVVGILRAPWGGATIKAVYAFPELTISASTANFYDLILQNGGAVGTSTTAIGTAGGTAGLTAITAETFTLNTSADELASGEWLKVVYDETGTVAPGEITICVEWVNGQG